MAAAPRTVPGLRDFFAAAALSGLLQRYKSEDYDRAALVQKAYHYADLMVAERRKKPAPTLTDVVPNCELVRLRRGAH